MLVVILFVVLMCALKCSYTTSKWKNEYIYHRLSLVRCLWEVTQEWVSHLRLPCLVPYPCSRIPPSCSNKTTTSFACRTNSLWSSSWKPATPTFPWSCTSKTAAPSSSAWRRGTCDWKDTKKKRNLERERVKTEGGVISAFFNTTDLMCSFLCSFFLFLFERPHFSLRSHFP